MTNVVCHFADSGQYTASLRYRSHHFNRCVDERGDLVILLLTPLDTAFIHLLLHAFVMFRLDGSHMFLATSRH